MLNEEMVVIPKSVALAIGQFLSRVQLQGAEAPNFMQCVSILQQAVQPQQPPMGLNQPPNPHPDPNQGEDNTAVP